MNLPEQNGVEAVPQKESIMPSDVIDSLISKAYISLGNRSVSDAESHIKSAARLNADYDAGYQKRLRTLSLPVIEDYLERGQRAVMRGKLVEAEITYIFAEDLVRVLGISDDAIAQLRGQISTAYGTRAVREPLKRRQQALMATADRWLK